MKKNINLMLLYLIVVILACATLTFYDQSRLMLDSGDTLPEDLSMHPVDVSALAGHTECSFTLCNPQCHELSLLLKFVSPYTVRVNGVPVEEAPADANESFYQVDIPHWLTAADQVEVTVTLSSVRSFSAVYIGSPEAIAHHIATETTMIFICMGVCFVVCIYSLSLFWGKRSEKYLLFLAAVAFVTLLLRTLRFPILGDAAHEVLNSLFPSLLSLSLYLNAVLFIKMSDIQLPRSLHWLVNWKTTLFITLLLVVWGVAFRSMYRYVLFVARLLIAAATLLCLGCSTGGRKGVRVLIVGNALHVGWRMAITIVDLFLSPARSGALQLIDAGQLDMLFFMLSASIYLNQLFAGKFTEAEELSHQLEEMNRSLDAKVEQRTAELREQQTQKHSLMLNTFHDLRSPLHVATGCIGTMRRERTYDPSLLDILEERLDFMRRLTEDLFTLAKLEDGKLLLYPDKLDFSALCQRQWGWADISAREKEVALESEIPPQIHVYGDERRLEQTVQNLIANCLHYTPAGGKVTVRLRCAAGWAELRIGDTGKGIDPADLPHVFSRYYHADGYKNPDASGLGLAIAQELTALHHGELTVDSAVGKGTEFTLKLPTV